jgi:hypothetical protein
LIVKISTNRSWLGFTKNNSKPPQFFLALYEISKSIDTLTAVEVGPDIAVVSTAISSGHVMSLVEATSQLATARTLRNKKIIFLNMISAFDINIM